MVLTHCLFALFCQLWRNFTEGVLAVPVHVEVVVFVEVEAAVRESPCTGTDLEHSKRHFLAFDLVEHEIGYCVAVERFEEFTGRDPSIFGVQALHFLAELVVALKLGKLDGFPQSAYLVPVLCEVPSQNVFARVALAIQSVVNELP